MNQKHSNRQTDSKSTHAERRVPEGREGAGQRETPHNTQKGGDRSTRAAHSGATGERSASGGENKPEPRNQDEKGMGHPRNG